MYAFLLSVVADVSYVVALALILVAVAVVSLYIVGSSVREVLRFIRQAVR